MTPFWSRRSGGSHLTSIDVEERIVIWIVFGVPDGSGEAKSNIIIMAHALSTNE